MSLDLDRAGRRELAQWMLDNWVDRADYHASWWAAKKMWFCKKEPLSLGTLERMLSSSNSNSPVGAYYVSPENTAKHALIDIDAHGEGEDADAPVRRVVDLLGRAGVPCVVARSKGGRGYHVRIRFDKPLPARVARNLGLDVVRSAGLPPDTEVFPKQEELRPGEFGSQAALPGSRHFLEKTGGRGSTLVYPDTLEPIPIEDWLDHLRSVPPLAEEALREMGRRVGADLWRSRRRRASGPAPKYTAEGLPELKTAGQLARFFADRGVEVGREKGAWGDWTDRLLLAACPNAEAHGSDRRDGAAVLFDEKTGRVGFKCHHAGCEGFSWPKLLRKLGFAPVRDGLDPRTREALERAAEHASDHCDCDEEPAREPPDPDPTAPPPRAQGSAGDGDEPRRCSDEEKALFAVIALDHERDPDPLLRRLARASEHVGLCQAITQWLFCEGTGERRGHGLKGTRTNDCKDGLLCKRAAYKRKMMHRDHVRENWPKVFVAEAKCAPTDTEEGYQAQRREVERMRAESSKVLNGGRKVQPRIIRGYDSILLVYLERYRPYARRAFPELEWREMTKRKVSKLVAEVYDSPHRELWRRIDRVGILVAVATSPWWLHNRDKQTTAGGDAAAELTWTTWGEEQAAAKERWREEHPGLEWGECDEVVGEEPDGSPKFCGCPYHAVAAETGTGERLGKRRGGFTDREVASMALGSGAHERWARGVLAKLAFSFAEADLLVPTG